MNDNCITKYDLASLDRVLARSFNVNLRSLNKNGWKGFCDIWINKYPIELNELEKLISNEEIFIGKKFNKNLIRQLSSPRLDKLLTGRISDSNKDNLNDFFNKKILNAIFKVMPEGIDPFYSELKTKYPILKTLFRFHYLQILYQINRRVIDKGKNIIHPIGYNERIVSIFDNEKYEFSDNNGVVLIASSLWIINIEKKEGTREEQENQAKHYYCCNRTRLCIENSLHELLVDLKENTKTNVALSFDEEQFLLGQCLCYQIVSTECLNSLIDNIEVSYEKLYQLFSNPQERRNYNELGNEDKFRFLASISSLLSIECKCLLKNQIASTIKPKKWWQLLFEKEKKDEILEFEIHFPLAKVGINILKLIYNVKTNDYSISIIKKENVSYSDVYFKNEKCEELSKDVYRLVSKAHREDIAKMLAREKATLSVFKHEFEKLPAPESWNGNIHPPPQQICLTLRHAKRLLLADYALYLEYDSIERELNCIDAIRNEFLLEIQDNSPEDKYRWEEDFVKKELRNLKVYDSETKYKSCICIRDEQIVSRFIWNGNDNKRTLLSNFINTDYRIGVIIKGIEQEEDNILMPIIAHNRKMGVLYLASNHKEHFKYFDRTRLVNFAQEIGVEIFEAKMLSTFQKLNQHLSAVLDKKEKEEVFMDNIAEEVARLFGAEGVVILWKQAQNTSHYQVVGRAGLVKHFFGLKQYVSTTHSIWNNSKGDYNSFTLNEESAVESQIIQMGYGSYIHIPMIMKPHNFNGYITLFDERKNSLVTLSQKEELRLLAIEVEQVMLRFFINQEVLKGIRATIGHDISSILRSINGTCYHLDRIIVTDANHRRNLQKQIGDIRGYMQYGKQLLDYFFDSLNEKDTTKTLDNFKNIPAFAERLKQLMSEDVQYCIQSYQDESQKIENDIYSIILSVLQSKNIFAKLDSFGLPYPVLDRKLRLIPSLWINSEVIRLIVNNLFDNFLKHHLPGTKLKIDSNRTDTGWEIFFENRAEPLSKDYEENTYQLFGYGIRFSKSSEGEGLGLFTSRTLIMQFGGDLTLNYKKDITNKGIFAFRLFLPDWLERKANFTEKENIWYAK